jgi:hypothetical protein
VLKDASSIAKRDSALQMQLTYAGGTNATSVFDGGHESIV